MKINEKTARKLYDEGRPVRFVTTKGASALGYVSAATARYGLSTFDQFKARCEELHKQWYPSGGGQWERPGPSRQTQDEAAGAIFRREEFRIGNLSGMTGTYAGWATGDLPQEYRGLVISASYVVRSYETPIAWIDKAGEVVMPPVRYSNTTTQHQLLAARALGVESFAATDGSVRKGRGKSPYGPGWQTTKGV